MPTSIRTLVQRSLAKDLELQAYAVPRISPDGARIAAHVDNPENAEVMVYDQSRKTWLRLTFDRSPDIRPLWTPDGKWILFRSEMEGPGIWPLWSHDGRELFYVSGRALMSVAVEPAGQAFRWGSAKKLFEGSYSGFQGLTGPRNYDVSADGQRFLMLKDETSEQAAGPLIIVENWAEELKRLVPTK